MQDINAIKSLLKLCFSIAIPIVKEAKKDGFQWTDIISFIGTDEFKAELSIVLKEMPELKAEFQDFTLEEGFELAGTTLTEIKNLIDAIKS